MAQRERLTIDTTKEIRLGVIMASDKAGMKVTEMLNELLERTYAKDIAFARDYLKPEAAKPKGKPSA